MNIIQALNVVQMEFLLTSPGEQLTKPVLNSFSFCRLMNSNRFSRYRLGASIAASVNDHRYCCLY